MRSPAARSISSCRRGGAIAFVEVKARADLDAAAEAITATKRRRIARAARVWLARNPWAVGPDLARRRRLRRARGAFPATRPARIGWSSTDRAARQTPDRILHALDRRRADGPDRQHPHRGRLDLRAPARGAGPRPSPAALHARPAPAQRKRASRPWPSRSRSGTSPATMPRLGEPQLVDLVDRRRRAAAPGPARSISPMSRRRISSSASIRRHARRQRSAQRPRRAGKAVRDGFSRTDAPDPDRPRPGRDRGLSRRAWRGRDEAALRLRRRGGVQGRRAGTRTSARCSICSRRRCANPG